ncbi:hypothetical protein EVAR_24078_1 [Eumeta japonica]|uniref:PPM-type phosphatase domain-containing protein n=1 Tax=Eumeta variegata TaxID=151549 RepID=A0A4C2AA58_EUMVA|nr:hypothetical protein EVAR_24078_1 [Eumeta japonica]
MTPLRRIILDEVVTAAKKQPEEFGFDSQNSVYIALRLMQAVTSHVNSVCLRYTDNARLDTLPAPGSVFEMRTASAATKNRRRVMEDRHVEIGDLEALFGIEASEHTSFYAVYDGHAGSAAATYCAAHLHQYLVESPYFAKDLPRALRDAFQRTDNEFVRKQNEKRACGGSTAVVVVIRGRMLHAAWAGDSQALLAKRMRLMQLVHPHKPNRQDERNRIEASGGTVMYWGIWRVNGQLAVSRAIGRSSSHVGSIPSSFISTTLLTKIWIPILLYSNCNPVIDSYLNPHSFSRIIHSFIFDSNSGSALDSDAGPALDLE